MNIKLTEIVRATTISLNIKDAPRQTSLLIHDAFAKLVADLDDRLYSPAEKALIAQWKADTPFVSTAPVEAADEQLAERLKQAITHGEQLADALAPAVVQKAAEDINEAVEQVVKRRGRPKKVEEPAPEAVEPTPLEQAIAAAEQEDKEPAGERVSTVGESQLSTSKPAETVSTESVAPVSDRDLQTYCVKAAQHYGGAAKVYELCKPFVEEGAVARPSNIKGDDKRWQFIRAVEADSGVKYHG
jgi:hypothetical protein